MPQVYSKIVPLTGTLSTTCVEYVHPWTNSCLQGITGLYLYAIFDCLRLYGSVYTFALLMKGRIPTRTDLKNTISGILQSTAFLSGTAFGYSFFLCVFRRVLGNFNILTISALPAFIASVFAIIIERPSRRTLLCLYVSNTATETVWNMAVSRNLVRNIKYGDAAIFSASMALLLMYYKEGLHKDAEKKSDSLFGVLRFVVGPHEEKDNSATQSNHFYRQQVRNNERTSGGSWRPKKPASTNPIFLIIMQALRVYKKIIYRLKCSDRHSTCSHPFSCIYYTLEGAGKMFSVGLGLQMALKIALNVRTILKSPNNAKRILFRRDNLNLGCFLGGYSALFRGVLCILRRATGKDSPTYAIPAGLIAGVAFTRFPDNTLALYVLWKAAQITYNLGIERGIVPKVPGFTEFLYCFSTAIIFHAAIMEPTNLRPSYWKFLHSISGGRIACMNRIPLDVWGLNTSESLDTILKMTKTQRILK